MPSISLSATPRYRAVILGEDIANRSRENAVVTQTGVMLDAGTLLTQAGDAGAATFSMDAGATGNPTVASIVITYPAIPGNYKVEFTAATKFDVEGPDGVLVGSGTVATAFSKGGLAFTIVAGGTAAVAGDTATIAVAVGNLKYAPYQAAGAAGPAHAVLLTPLPAYTGDKQAVVIVRAASLNRAELTGLDTAGEADLKKIGLIVRGKSGLPGRATPAL